MTCFANSDDLGQLAYEEANGSVSALFVIKYEHLYEKLGKSDWVKIRSGVASCFIQHGKGSGV